jgi:hypothetical protein
MKPKKTTSSSPRFEHVWITTSETFCDNCSCSRSGVKSSSECSYLLRKALDAGIAARSQDQTTTKKDNQP